jgi:hypothetical protein
MLWSRVMRLGTEYSAEVAGNKTEYNAAVEGNESEQCLGRG